MKKLSRALSIMTAAVLALLSASSFADDVPASRFFSKAPSGFLLFKLSLEDVARVAIDNSHNLKAQLSMASAASEAAASAKTKIFPQLGLSGQARALSKVGQVTLPTGTSLQMGDHYSWAVGPVLDWVAWDEGAIAKKAKSLKHAADSERLSADVLKRNVLLNARIAYFSAQLASEQLRLVGEALFVARAQYNDVLERHQVGSASKLDLTSAHQEVVDRERDYEDAQAELAVQVRNLVANLNLEQVGSASFPADVKFFKQQKSIPIKPDLLLDFELLSNSITKMQPKAAGMVEISKHPSVMSAKERVDAAMFSWQSVKAGHWPKINVEGKSTYEYPNFAQLERIQQNQLTVGLQMPIIDWGMISKQARSERYKAFAASEQMREAETNLASDLGQAKDRIAVLTQARTTCSKAVKDAVEVARLVYEEYIAGHVIFLEVQRANYRALQSKVDAARNDAGLLGALAHMESLITGNGEKNDE